MRLIKFYVFSLLCCYSVVLASAVGFNFSVCNNFKQCVFAVGFSQARLATTHSRISVTGRSCYIHVGRDTKLKSEVLFVLKSRVEVFKAAQWTKLTVPHYWHVKLLKAAEVPEELGNLQSIGCTNNTEKHLHCQSSQFCLLLLII